MSDDLRDEVAGVLWDHRTVRSGLGEWCCGCSPAEWRPTAHRERHQADALAPLLARREAEARAAGLAEERAWLLWHISDMESWPVQTPKAIQIVLRKSIEVRAASEPKP